MNKIYLKFEKSEQHGKMEQTLDLNKNGKSSIRIEIGKSIRLSLKIEQD